MSYLVEIELPAGQACGFYLEEDYFHEYDTLPGRQALSSDEKSQRRERDKDLFLTEYYADYDWGQYAWSYPEVAVQNLLWLIEQIDEIADVRPPTSNDELEAVQKQAVSEGWLIPEIEEHLGGMYAPLAAPASATRDNGGIRASVESFEPFRSTTMRSGEPVLSGPYDPATQEARLSAASGALSADDGTADENSFDLLGTVESAAGALLGGSDDDSDGGDDTPDLAESMSDDAADGAVSDDSTPLGDAQPFEYGEDMPSGDVQDLAARGVSETEEAECFAEYETDMELCSAGGAMFNSFAYYQACTQRAFLKYQQCRGY